MNQELSFQKVYELLDDILPDQWKKIAFYVQYGDDSYSMKYYYKDNSDVYHDCFENGITKSMRKTFDRINKYILSFRKKTPTKNELWSVMTMIISSDGKFKVDYDYSDISDDPVGYTLRWKKQYLI